jgi:1,4-alpha-glucan branching enzyme
MPGTYVVVKAPSEPNSGMGANLLSGGQQASFRVWAPDASDVRVLLRATDADSYQTLPLTADVGNQEYFSADIAGIDEGHQYRFRITNSGVGDNNPGGIFERIDPYTREVESAEASAPGYVVHPGFPFVSFRTPRWEDFIIYQLHIGSFAGLNDGLRDQIKNDVATFRQIADHKLDRIRALEFNAVQFLPTSQTPLKATEGYAPANFFAPDDDYGDPVDLCYLVDQCHRRGLAVILDVVYNHVTDSEADDRLLQFDGNTVNRGRGIYFSEFDNFGPVPDFDREEVRNFFLDNARQCFREFGVDGLRFDSAHAIRGRLRSFGVMKEIVDHIRAEFPDKLLIAEHDNPSFAVDTLDFSASWQMSVADDFINTILTGPLGQVEGLVSAGGLPHAFTRVAYLLGSHDQIFSDYRRNPLSGEVQTGKPLNRYFVERVGGVIVGRDDFIARSKARMGWALNVTMPCTPMAFMGTECHHHGYWNPAQDFFGEHRLDFALVQDSIGQEMAALVRDANRLRWDHPALRTDSLLVTHRDWQDRVLGFKRFDDRGDVLLVVLNMSDNEWRDPVYGVGLLGDRGTYTEIFNSQAPLYGGIPDSGNFQVDLPVGDDGQIRIRLPKWSVLVFRKR